MSNWDQSALDRHNAAWQAAKDEAICCCGSVVMLTGKHEKNCPRSISNLLARAEEIRKVMEAEHGKIQI
jgi:hypothetical protein